MPGNALNSVNGISSGELPYCPKTVVHAAADAKRAAQSMIDYMEGNLAPAAAPVAEG